MRPESAELIPHYTMTTHSGPGGGTVYRLYVARYFRDDGHQPR